MSLPASLPELVACPDPACGALAEVVDRFRPDPANVAGARGPVVLVTTACARGHHYQHEEA